MFKGTIRLTIGAESLVGNLLSKTTAALLDGAHVGVAGSKPALEQPRAELGTKLRDEDEDENG